MRHWFEYIIILLAIILISIVFGVVGFIVAIVAISTLLHPIKATEYTSHVEVKDTDILTVPRKYYEQYRVYLKSDEWYALRKLVLKRDGFRCVRCSTLGDLQCHHTNYNGVETMTFSIDQLESVCKECHKNIHYGYLPMKKES